MCVVCRIEITHQDVAEKIIENCERKEALPANFSSRYVRKIKKVVDEMRMAELSVMMERGERGKRQIQEFRNYQLLAKGKKKITMLRILRGFEIFLANDA